MPIILLIDDDDDTREAIVLFLQEEEGYDDVIECATGPEAVRHLTTAAAPLLVMMDYHLPDLAEPLCDFIARTPILRDRHAYIIISAHPQAEAHAHGWLVVKKPFSLETLSEALTTTWTQFQQKHSAGK